MLAEADDLAPAAAAVASSGPAGCCLRGGARHRILRRRILRGRVTAIAGALHRALAVLRVGKRFSKTTTSYSGAGISVRLPAVEGHSGHWPSAGWKVRSWRWLAMTTHSPSSRSRAGL